MACGQECAAPTGRKFFYNKETKVSSWTMPPEVKVSLLADATSSLGDAEFSLGDANSSLGVFRRRAMPRA
jgi:hypothetical protein